MAEALIVRFLPHTEPGVAAVEWLIDSGVRRDGAQPRGVHRGALSEAAAHVAGRRVVVLAPGADVLLAEPVLPLKSSAKLAQVVPFALEEHLAADVEDLHFAVGRRQMRGATPVAVAAHQKVQAWRAALADAGLFPEAIYAETAALPETPNGVTLLIENNRVYVRRLNAPGAVLEVEPLIEALQLALASGDDSREHVTIYVSDTDYERERDLLEGLREFTASLQLKLLPEGALPLFAANLTPQSMVNLLQGPYAVQTKLRMSLAPWRYAAILAGVFFACHLGLKSWQYVHYSKQEAQLDQQIVQVFQQSMPGAPAPDPGLARKQMEARLAQLRGAGPVGGMMPALATVTAAMAQAPGANVEAISYRNNVTDLRVLAPSVDALDRIRQVATERGMTAELQAANPRESKFEGRLQFKSAG